MVRTRPIDGEITLIEWLRTFYVTSKNHVKWGDLAGTLFGAFLFQLWSGVIKLPLAIATGIEDILGSISTALNGGVKMVTTTLVSEFGAVWDPVNAGVFSVILNLAILLTAVYAVTKGYEVMTDG